MNGILGLYVDEDALPDGVEFVTVEGKMMASLHRAGVSMWVVKVSSWLAKHNNTIMRNTDEDAIKHRKVRVRAAPIGHRGCMSSHVE